MIQKNKKSQITIFLILGVVLIIIVTTLAMITRYVNKKKASNEVIASFAQKPFDMRSGHDMISLFENLGLKNPAFLK